MHKCCITYIQQTMNILLRGACYIKREREGVGEATRNNKISRVAIPSARAGGWGSADTTTLNSESAFTLPFHILFMSLILYRSSEIKLRFSGQPNDGSV